MVRNNPVCLSNTISSGNTGFCRRSLSLISLEAHTVASSADKCSALFMASSEPGIKPVKPVRFMAKLVTTQCDYWKNSVDCCSVLYSCICLLPGVEKQVAKMQILWLKFYPFFLLKNNTVMFELKSYLRKELSILYFPNSSARRACLALRKWLEEKNDKNPELIKDIHCKEILPKPFVKQIVDLLGEA